MNSSKKKDNLPVSSQHLKKKKLPKGLVRQSKAGPEIIYTDLLLFFLKKKG
jgi:hypothetical protein